MKRKPRSSRSPEHASLSGDPLDRAAWEALRGAILAAGMGNANSHAEVFRHWPGSAAAEGRRASAYLWYLLRYRIAEVLGRRPTTGDLHDLVTRAYPRFGALIRGDEGRLEVTFRTVLEGTAAEDHLKGSMFLILGTAALGSLMDDADRELDAMRPHLLAWWRGVANEFQQMGVE
jgi:hypothetical protein